MNIPALPLAGGILPLRISPLLREQAALFVRTAAENESLPDENESPAVEARKTILPYPDHY